MCVCVCVCVCVDIVFLFLVFERQTYEVSFYVTQFSETEVFAGEALVLGEISFLILLSSVWTTDIFSLLILKTSIFIEDSPGNKHSRLANQSKIISYSTTSFRRGQPIKYADLGLWKEYPLHISDFNPINHNIGARLIKGAIPRLLWNYLFSHWPRQKLKVWLIYHKIWSLTPTGEQVLVQDVMN